MNDQIPPDRFDDYLRFLERAGILARGACREGDAARGEAILDAVHNLPRFLVGQERPGFEIEFYALYVEPLVRRYPELQSFADDCPRVGDRKG